MKYPLLFFAFIALALPVRGDQISELKAEIQAREKKVQTLRDLSFETFAVIRSGKSPAPSIIQAFEDYNTSVKALKADAQASSRLADGERAQIEAKLGRSAMTLLLYKEETIKKVELYINEQKEKLAHLEGRK